MPTMAIYRANKLIWSKHFNPPNNGVLELHEPVKIKKGDIIYFHVHHQDYSLAHYACCGGICVIIKNESEGEK
jgi:hypothetical protein